jgi:pseudouridine-5'-phosphate glycosidase
MTSGVLVVVPPPVDAALPNEMIESAVAYALAETVERGIRGQAVTPFLLARVSEITGGASLNANLALLHNNAHIATQIARELQPPAFREG